MRIAAIQIGFLDGMAAMTIAVVIVAAGRGRRLGGEIPKQYIPLGEKSALRRSVEVFLSHDAIGWIVPVIHPDDRDLFDDALLGLNDRRLLDPVLGSDTRGKSVRNGLDRLAENKPHIALIHDAARPFLPNAVIDRVLEALKSSDGACAALPVVDALWTSENNTALDQVPREGLWRAQTPQGFDFEKIREAHRLHDGDAADDVAVAKAVGLSVQLVTGSEQNYKITTTADLERALIDAQHQDSDL
ncbi:MAG: 2-C-methyl-D-erythritol 4-phosphate cytidylyltransferase [Roseobacter sp.]